MWNERVCSQIVSFSLLIHDLMYSLGQCNILPFIFMFNYTWHAVPCNFLFLTWTFDHHRINASAVGQPLIRANLKSPRFLVLLTLHCQKMVSQGRPQQHLRENNLIKVLLQRSLQFRQSNDALWGNCTQIEKHSKGPSTENFVLLILERLRLWGMQNSYPVLEMRDIQGKYKK